MHIGLLLGGVLIIMLAGWATLSPREQKNIEQGVPAVGTTLAKDDEEMRHEPEVATPMAMKDKAEDVAMALEKKSDATEKMLTDEPMQEKKEVMTPPATPPSTMVKPVVSPQAPVAPPPVMATKQVGTYEPYAPEKLIKAETGDVVLFFRASWCPGCRALDADIRKNLGAIPGDLTILELNYDTENALKQKYGVTYQHTLVQVRSDGTLVKKWSGGSTLSSVIDSRE